MAGDPFYPPVTIGFVPPFASLQASNPIQLALNSATTYLAFNFRIPATKTLNKVQVYCSGKTGSPTAAGTTCGIHPDSSGEPNATATETRQLAGVPSSAAWNEWTGFTTSCTADTEYWMVIKNATGTPGSNYATWQFISRESVPLGASTANAFGYYFGWGARYTTNGTAWSSGGSYFNQAMGIRLEFSDGSFAGLPIQATAIDTTDMIYSAREYGVKFTIPAGWPTINVKRACFDIASAGTQPSGGMRYRIYTGATTTPTLAGTSITAAQLTHVNGGWKTLPFASAVALTAGTTVRVVCGVVSGGDASNNLRQTLFTLENSAGSKGLTQFGALTKTYTTDGTTFTDTDTGIIPWAIQLDTAGEFTVSAAGGLFRSGLLGGL